MKFSIAISLGLGALLLGCNKSETTNAGPSAASAAATAANAAKPPAAAPAGTAANEGAKSKSGKFPGTEAGAKELLGEFLKPGADYAALTHDLRPTADDYKAIFIDDNASKAEAHYKKLWDDPKAAFKPNEGQTALLIWSATSDDVKNWTGNAAKEFPGGYKKIGDKLKPGLTFYRWKFVKPGETLGMAFDGLVYVNGHWAAVPKPWSAIGGSE